MKGNYFFRMIQHLRQTEEVVLYANVLSISENELARVGTFLAGEYQRESLNYPFHRPFFHTSAAIWGAQTLYISAQLLLYRKHAGDKLRELFPKPDFLSSPETMLSADLCLRFLPGIYEELENIDPEDPLLPILEEILIQWHYSSISNVKVSEKINHQLITSKLKLDPCFRQLYVDRIIKYKNHVLAAQPFLNREVQAVLGIHGEQFWPELKPIEK